MADIERSFEAASSDELSLENLGPEVLAPHPAPSRNGRDEARDMTTDWGDDRFDGPPIAVHESIETTVARVKDASPYLWMLPLAAGAFALGFALARRRPSSLDSWKNMSSSSGLHTGIHVKEPNVKIAQL